MTGALLFGTACLPGTGNVDTGKDENRNESQLAQADQNDQDSEENNNTEEGNNEKDNDKEENVSESNYELAPMDTKFHAFYDGKIIYREYKKGDLVSPVYVYFGISSQFDQETARTRNIMSLNDDGTTEVLLSDDLGYGTIYAYGDKMFSQAVIDDPNRDHVPGVYYYDFSANEYGYLDQYSNVNGGYKEYVFVECSYGYGNEYIPGTIIWDSKNNKEIAVANGDYLTADEDGLYTTEFVYDYSGDVTKTEFHMYKTSYEGVSTELCYLDYETYFTEIGVEAEWPEFTGYQMLEDRIVFNIGGYGGTGHFYQCGNLFYAMKDGSKFELIQENNQYPEFYCTEDENGIGINTVSYDYDKMEVIPLFCPLEGNPKPIDNYEGQTWQKPYITGHYIVVAHDDNEGIIETYPDATGNLVVLIEQEDYKKFGFEYGYDADEYETAPITEIYNIEYLGDKLFYTVSYMERSPEDDIGWRYAYNYTRNVDFVKDLKTGEVSILFEY